MSKITLADLNSLQNENTALTVINNNSAIIEAAIDNTLSRDGTSPNQMAANIDMNNNRIINLPVATSQQEPLRLADITDFTQFQNSVNLAAALAAASASATAAGNSATNAATSATNASTSATNANTAVGSLGLLASAYGVTGDGSDQTTALANAVAALPAVGGNIILPPGTITITSLNLQTKRNIRFIGQGGNGGGADQRTMIISNVGVGVPRIIDCRDTTNVSFENLYINATNVAFTGILLDYSKITTGSFSMELDNCFVNIRGTSAIGLYLGFSGTGSFSLVTFSGYGVLVRLPVSGSEFCTEMAFDNCNFLPLNNQYPITGSGSCICFNVCNWQAGSDGRGRALQSSSSVPMYGLSFSGCGFLDLTTSGTVWLQLTYGGGLHVDGSYVGLVNGSYFADIGGGATGDPENSGWGGVALFGNSFQSVNTGAFVLALDGTAVNGSNVRGITCGGNSLINCNMYSNIASAGVTVNLPNRVYSGKNGVDETLTIYNIPTTSVGLTTGQIYSNSGVLTIV